MKKKLRSGLNAREGGILKNVANGLKRELQEWRIKRGKWVKREINEREIWGRTECSLIMCRRKMSSSSPMNMKNAPAKVTLNAPELRITPTTKKEKQMYYVKYKICLNFWLYIWIMLDWMFFLFFFLFF